MPNLQTFAWMCGKSITETTVNATTLKCNISSMFQTFGVTEFSMLLTAPAPPLSRIFTKKEWAIQGRRTSIVISVLLTSEFLNARCQQ